MIVRELLMRLGFDVDDGALRDASSRLDAVRDAALELFSTVAIGATIRAGVNWVEDLQQLGDQYADLADRTGLSTLELREWNYVAQRSGLETGAFNGALMVLTRTIGRASSGNADAARLFRQLGVSIRGPNGELRRAGDVMGDAIDSLGRMQNDTQRNIISQRLFGRSGRELAAVFAQGEGAVSRFRNEVRELYGDDFEEFTGTSARIGDRLDQLGLRFEALRVSIGNAVLPIFEMLVDRGEAVTRGLGELLDRTTAVRGGLFALAFGAIPILAVGLALISPLTIAAGATALALAVSFAAVGFALDDYTVAMEGGDSITRRMLLSMGELLFGTERAGLALEIAQRGWLLLGAAVASVVNDPIAFFRDLISDSLGLLGRAFPMFGAISNVVSALGPIFTTVANAIGTALDAFDRFLARSATARAIAGEAAGLFDRFASAVGGDGLTGTATRALLRTDGLQAYAASVPTASVPAPAGVGGRQSTVNIGDVNVAVRTSASDITTPLVEGVSRGVKGAFRNVGTEADQ